MGSRRDQCGRAGDPAGADPDAGAAAGAGADHRGGVDQVSSGGEPGAEGADCGRDLAAAQIWPGWDFVNNDGYPNDDNGHGTHVATTLVSPVNDGIGIAGVAPGCTIMPIKVLGPDASGSYENIAGGIRYAADQGAQIINLSLTGTEPSAILQDAVQYAAAKGCLIVAAAGNESRYGVGYPARFPQCIAVGATRFDGQLADYSDRGSGLTLVAPGGDTTLDQNG